MDATCPAHLILPGLSFKLYLAKRASYEVPHYAISSNLPLLHPSPQHPVLKCHNLQNHRLNYCFVYFNFYVFKQESRRQKVVDCMVPGITQNELALNILKNRQAVSPELFMFLKLSIYS